MKKPLLLLLLLALTTLAGCNYMEEKEAEKIITNYYQALIDEDYETAFSQLLLYDFDPETGAGHYTEGTTLSEDEAKAFYFEKVQVLKEQDYQLKDFEIVEVEYEDGHSFWHHLKLTVEHGNQTVYYDEVADIHDGKLVIGEKNDPFAKYRDGKMNFKLEHHTSLKEEYLNRLNAAKKETEELRRNSEQAITIELKNIEGGLFDTWDGLLNEVYGILEDQLPLEEMEQLRIEQREWIKHRDAAAKEASLKYEGGTMEHLEYVVVLNNETGKRCFELVENYMK